ncbi:hypothetical protein F2Q69_00006022 [Brassica cretica]|uniref:Uncharacterized protein n=1 Tax=Brassica cretica TaxID=69181 RepID=A0A8S9NM92_BRACR|nr:hypothetical protein F2Q69_00006022 [Brassica cretica]
MDSWSPEIVLVTRRLLEDPEVVWRPGGRGGARRRLRPYRNPEVSSLDPEIFDWNPEEPEGSSLDPEIFDWNPEAIGEPGGTELRLPRQGYYRYLFGFCIMLLGSWLLSSSYSVFYFCRKSLTGFRGC